jgi:septum formation protein
MESGQTVMSAVRMCVLSAAELEDYIASNRWQGKAGGYGIQDPDPIVTCLGGSVSNIVGLPMSQTRRLLEQAGITPRTPDNPQSGHEAGPSV